MSDESVVVGWTKLGGLVGDRRRSLGLAQGEVAERAGVARSWLARVEAGHRRAELEPLLRLAGALDLDIVLRVRPIRPDADRAAETVAGDGVVRVVRTAAESRRVAWGLPVSAGAEGVRDV
ncbi:MAG: helix-turn-helix transcriptional regulator [Propionibacteriaceae bacterium]|nr:helix-turn-helix transcriptional regulator [Propionibacteriaceae bacterium]